MVLDILKSPKIEKKLTTKQALLIALICFVVGSVIFTLAYISMSHNVGLGTLDKPFLSWIIQYRNSTITDIAKVVTAIASPMPFIMLVTVIICAWAIYKHEIWRPLLIAISMALTTITTILLKDTTMHLRPPKMTMIPAFELNYSFPSGHTISVMVLLLVIGYLIYSRNYSFARTWLWFLFALVGASMIAMSRLYLGYHWLTDVVASIGLGFIILSVVILIDRIAIAKFDKLK